MACLLRAGDKRWLGRIIFISWVEVVETGSTDEWCTKTAGSRVVGTFPCVVGGDRETPPRASVRCVIGLERRAVDMWCTKLRTVLRLPLTAYLTLHLYELRLKHLMLILCRLRVWCSSTKNVLHFHGHFVSNAPKKFFGFRLFFIACEIQASIGAFEIRL